MELFYYCISAPKEEERHIHQYTPGYDQFDYHNEQQQAEGGACDSDSECTPEPAPTFEELNDSLHELELDPAGAAEGALSPVEEDPDLQVEEVEPEISLDSLSDKLKDKEAVAAAAEETHDSERERLARELENLNRRLAEAEDTIQRFQSDNRLLQQRVDISERERSAMQHGNYVELEKVREEYQSKLNDMALYREKLRTAEARGEDAESTTAALKSQLAQKNATIEELNAKIDTFQEQIGRLKEKFSSVSEDNIELANKAQSHEKKVMEADLHNKNLMDLVAQKEDTNEQHQLKIEELMRENAELSLQLEGSLGDCRRQVESIKERSVLKERSSTTRIDELEAQLGRATTTQTQLKRLKDEPKVAAVRVEVDAPLPPPPAAASPSISDNNASEGKGKNRKSGSSSSSSSSVDTSDEEPDWAELLKSAEANRERLGLNVEQPESDGESSVDEEGNRYVKKKSASGLTGQDYLNRVATNQLLGTQLSCVEFGRTTPGNYVELEKVREEYQSKLNDMALYREKLRTAEARGEDAESTTAALKSQLAQKNATIEELNTKIDTFQEQIGRLKEKFSSVSEDNIELANKAQSHEKKVMEADLHNKNLMDLVAQKEDTNEQHQLKIEELMRENAELSLQLEGSLGDCRRQVESIKERSVLKERSSTTRIDELEAQLGRATTTQTQLKRLKDEPKVAAVRVEVDAPLPPPPAAASPSISDNNASEGKGKNRKSGSSSSSSSSVDTSDEEPDWAELLKSAEANRERLGLNVEQPESDGESSVDEEGNRYVKKKSASGLTGQDYLNRVATNQLLGYDEFGRPMGKSNGSMGMMGGGKSGRNRALLFGMDQGKRNGARGSNNKSSSERRSGGGRSGGRRNKGEFSKFILNVEQPESDGESSVDEEGNRYVKKKSASGLTGQDYLNRVATNQLLGTCQANALTSTLTPRARANVRGAPSQSRD
eukprot:sb/3461728/